MRINLKEKISFCYADFAPMTPVNFRQYISKLRRFIVIVCKSKPCFYRIVGTPERMAVPSITDRPTGDNMLMMLRNAREQPTSIHDIRIYTHCENFHEILKKSGYKPNKHNSGIILPPFHYDINIHAKVHVYPQSISIDIACTNRPLVYDIAGVVQLLLVLGQLYRDMVIISNRQAKFPPVTDWIAKQYHLGKDGTQSFSGQSFEMRMDELTAGSFRYYNKLGDDGKRKLRVEQIVTPNKTLMQEIDYIIAQEESHRNSYLENNLIDD